MIRKIIVLAGVLLLSGCATIMHGDSQYIVINSQPSEARIRVAGKSYITPTRVLFKRGLPIQEYQILAEKEGSRPATAKINRRYSSWLWGDILWGVIPGIAIDTLTGAAFDLYPDQLTVNLQESAK